MADVERSLDAADGFAHFEPEAVRGTLVVEIQPWHELGTCIQEHPLDAQRAG